MPTTPRAWWPTIAQAYAAFLADLKARGDVERVPDAREDGQAQLVCLTDRGWDVVAVGTRIIEEIESGWAQLLRAQRMQELRAMLEDLAHNRWAS